MKIKILLLFLGLGLALFSCTKRKPEEIDYAPNSPFNPYPPDSATNVEHTTLDVTLRWTATDPNSGDVLTYTVYFDTLDPPANQVASGLTSASYFVTGLKYKTTYYWKLYITDDAGVMTNGPVWRFTTLPHANAAPSVPAYLEPPNDTVGIYPSPLLSWTGSDPNGASDTVSYYVYLGLAAVPALVKSTKAFSYQANHLNYSTLYRWQIVATDIHGASSAGPVARFTTRASPWFLRAPMPLARKGFATAMAYNKIYVIGGTDENNTVTGTVQEYDPVLNVWNIRSSMPMPRYDLAAATANNLIYAIGGKNHSDSIVGATEAYNPITDSWTVKRPLVIPRYSLTAQTVNGLVYALNGRTKANTRLYALAEVYTPSFNRWTYIRIFPRPGVFIPAARTNTMSGVINGMIYVAGGYDTFEKSYYGGLDIFNPSTPAWGSGMYLPVPRTAGLGVVANGCFYLIGGYNGDYLRRVDKYDPGTGLWAMRGDMLNSRSGCGGGALNSSIFVVGGVNPLPVLVAEEYQTGLDP